MGAVGWQSGVVTDTEHRTDPSTDDAVSHHVAELQRQGYSIRPDALSSDAVR